MPQPLRQLTIKSRYVRLVLEGRKRSTIRLGNLAVNSKYVKVVSSGRPIAIVRVDSVVHKKVKDLTDEDAVYDGFRGLPELFRELRSIYGDFTLEDEITIIRFSLVRTLVPGGYDGLRGRPRRPRGGPQ